MIHTRQHRAFARSFWVESVVLVARECNVVDIESVVVDCAESTNALNVAVVPLFKSAFRVNSWASVWTRPVEAIARVRKV